MRAPESIVQSSSSALAQLVKMGFRSAGRWNCNGAELSHTLEKELAQTSVFLYAFVGGEDVRYIGKSTQSLRKRMSQYRNPEKSQSTNVRINARIKKIPKDEAVEVYVLPDNGLLYYGGFRVNLAAGLEDSLISTLKPAWNGRNDRDVAAS